MNGYVKDKGARLAHPRRAEGQSRWLQRMVEEHVYCIDALTQAAAANKPLHAVTLELPPDHMGHRLAEAAACGGEEADAKIKKVGDATARLVRY